MSWYLAVLRNYVGFAGRARRREYWMFVLFNILAAIVLPVLGVTVAILLQAGTALEAVMIPYSLYLLATALPSLAVAFRRLHDTGRSGWWLLISFVPFAGAVTLLVFLASEGTAASNEYGPSPKLGPAAA
ncbi:DUF805 domain-containing protein [Streptomyces sp. NPDC008150]|uniref:DUF805 domain-containing protein n=1 Tax=Streptomyces sp. NPDC008150 TaxID=3364816 RepID=UPI0036EF4267